MRKRCRNEVEQLHMFFEHWVTGAAKPTEENFARVAAVLADDFALVSPNGAVKDRETILADIRRAHADRDAASRIWVDEFNARVETPDFLVATYREGQMRDGEETVRLSTVVFRPAAGTPNGVSWHHLHETWIASRGPV